MALRNLLLRRTAATLCTAITVAVVLAASPIAAQAPTGNFDSLEFRYLAPPGNKTIAVAGVPGDPMVVYAAQPSGGVFKSTDGGFVWQPIFDNPRGISSIGAIAVAPSASEIVWVGTGDSKIRSNVSIGDGVYRSTDAGATWSHVGLDLTGRIARLAIHPTNPDIAFAAALGHGYAPQKERGLYRTRDGGRSWERVLFVDESTGAVDVIIDPSDPEVVLAAMWQYAMMPAGHEGGGPGSGIYRSRDGGTTWQRLSNGLPPGPMGRPSLAMAPSHTKRLYALLSYVDNGPWLEPAETANRPPNPGSLWVSDDGGDSWTLRNKDPELSGRALYFGRMAVFPDNPDELWILAQTLYVSRDGGATTHLDQRFYPDNHDVWIDPENPRRFILANDRYVYFSEDRGQSVRLIDLPNAQIYRVHVDHKVPYNVYGHRHDGSGYRGPNTSRRGATITSEDWSPIGGAEIGVTRPDPFDEDFAWQMSAFNFDYVDQRSGQRRNVMPWPPAEPWERRTPPSIRVSGLAMLPSIHRPRHIYAGSQYLHVSYDLGKTWQIISPDLTAGNRWTRPSGLWADMIHTDRSALFTIEESPLVPGLIWTGSSDGLLHVTRDGGETWTNLTDNLPGVGPFGVVSSIEASNTSPGAAYVTIDRHKMNDRTAYVFKTTDFGATWKPIARGIPNSVVSYARVIKEDPRRPGLLYLGTEGGLYLSVDDGGSWAPLNSGLPRAPISSIAFQNDYNDLVVATFGRGIWVMDDIAPIQRFTADVADSTAHLFPVRPTYVLTPEGPWGGGARRLSFDAPSNQATKASQGAPITYYLKAGADTPVRVQVFDDKGVVVRTLQGPPEPGIHRIWWKLDRDPEEGEPPGERTQVQPGEYRVRLLTAGVEQETWLVLLEDPKGPSSSALPPR